MKQNIMRVLLCLMLLGSMLLLCACPGGEPPVVGPGTDPGNGGEETPPAPEGTVWGEGQDISGAGDSLAAGAPVLSAITYDESTAQEIPAGNFMRIVGNNFGAGKVFRATTENPARVSAQEGKTYNGRGSVLILPYGLDINDNVSLTMKDLVIVGNVTLSGCSEAIFENVQIVGDLTVKSNCTGVVLNGCRLTGENTVSLAGSTHGIINSYIGFTAVGLTDKAADTVVKNCRFEGNGTAILSAATGSSYTYNTIKLSAADTGVSFDGAQNSVAGMNVIRGAQQSVTLSGVRNTVVVRNSLISVLAENGHAVFVCDNAMGGRLTAKKNDYILADGNAYPEDGKSHTAVREGNDHESGDTLLNVDARLEVGADESLLPQVDRDLFIGMQRRETVREEGVAEEIGVYSYILREARTKDVVIVTPGAYTIYEAAKFDIQHANTTVYAYGVMAEAYAPKSGNYTGGHLRFIDTADITIKGITAAYAQSSCGQIYVLEKISSSGTSGELRVVTGAGMQNMFGDSDPAFFDTTGIGIQRAGTFYAIGDFSIREGSIRKNSTDGTMRVAVPDEVYDLIEVGDIMTCRLASGSVSHQSSGSSNIVFKDMTNYGYAGGFAFHESKNLTATTYYRVLNTTQNGPVIEKVDYERYKGYEAQYGTARGIDLDLEISIDEQGRYRGSLPHIGSIDATHTSSCAEGSQVISCLFENMCDDGTNQNSAHARLSDCVINENDPDTDEDDTITLIYKGNLSSHSYSTTTNKKSLHYNRYCSPFRVGDRVFVYTSAGQLVCDGEALTVTEPHDTIYSTHPHEDIMGKSITRYKVTVPAGAVNLDALKGFNLSDDHHNADEKVLVDNRSLSSNNFHFDNTVVQNVRSRGVLIKASNGTVEHCTFRNIAKVAVAIIYEIQWGESGVSENVTVRNNLIDHTSYSPGGGIYDGIGYVHVPIDIIGMGGQTVDPDFMLYKSIQIIGNKLINRVIDRTPYAMYIQAACDVTIKDNDFGSTESGEFKALWVSGVLNVELSGNLYPPYIAGQLDYYVEGEHYANIFGDDVLNFIPNRP